MRILFHKRSDCGASLIEYAIATMLILATVLGAITFLDRAASRRAEQSQEVVGHVAPCANLPGEFSCM